MKVHKTPLKREKKGEITDGKGGRSREIFHFQESLNGTQITEVTIFLQELKGL